MFWFTRNKLSQATRTAFRTGVRVTLVSAAILSGINTMSPAMSTAPIALDAQALSLQDQSAHLNMTPVENIPDHSSISQKAFKVAEKTGMFFNKISSMFDWGLKTLNKPVEFAVSGIKKTLSFSKKHPYASAFMLCAASSALNFSGLAFSPVSGLETMSRFLTHCVFQGATAHMAAVTAASVSNFNLAPFQNWLSGQRTAKSLLLSMIKPFFNAKGLESKLVNSATKSLVAGLAGAIIPGAQYVVNDIFGWAKYIRAHSYGISNLLLKQSARTVVYNEVYARSKWFLIGALRSLVPFGK